MNKLRDISVLLLLLLAGAVRGALHVDCSGGLSVSSQYRYYENEPVDNGTRWLTFDPINAFCVTSRISVDIWKSEWRFGVAGGFLHRYKLCMHSLSGTTERKEPAGEVLSVPVIGFVEGHRASFFYEFGLGPYITRFNYTGLDNPDFSVASLFGYLFGMGYKLQLLPGVCLLAKGELLVNAPVFVVDFLDERMQEEIHASRFTEYNSNEFQTVIYSAVFSAGLQYEFGRKVRIPLDDGVEKLGGLAMGAVERMKKIKPGKLTIEKGER